ncbi:hypothetical protein CEXT_746461 [Caerostris extrusa]|uniref:Uncharacterized protein n=1 Tax=Caerostris extrusa TaxID=172846 RepID=A0AAV4QD73_CAEEX|nr:hypothetical protein CEXT_746461 [Caerostris extrusa]
MFSVPQVQFKRRFPHYDSNSLWKRKHCRLNAAFVSAINKLQNPIQITSESPGALYFGQFYGPGHYYSLNLLSEQKRSEQQILFIREIQNSIVNTMKVFIHLVPLNYFYLLYYT